MLILNLLKGKSLISSVGWAQCSTVNHWSIYNLLPTQKTKITEQILSCEKLGGQPDTNWQNLVQYSWKYKLKF